MKKGICNICHKHTELYDNGAGGGCQAEKAGRDFGDWLINLFVKKIKSLKSKRR